MDDNAPARLFSARRTSANVGLAHRGDWGIALLLGAIAFLVYLWSIVPSAFPGEPARRVAAAVGVNVQTSAQHVVWNGLVSAVANLGPHHLSFRVNLLSAVLGGIAVGLLFLVVSRLLALIIDELSIGRLPPSRQHIGIRIARSAVLLGGVASSLALAFSIPFWIAATQSYYHTFYIAWLLFSALLLLQYLRSDRLGWAVAFAAVHGAGMSQTSAFVAFAPLLGGTLLFAMWRQDRLSPRALLPVALAGFAGGALIFVNAAVFYRSEGFVVMGYGGYFQIIRLLLNSLRGGITGSLPRVGWMIVIGLTVAPWLAALAASARALNGEQDWSFYGLHVAILVVTLVVLAEVPAAPFQLLGMGDSTLVPYLLTAMTFGYLAAYLFLLPAHLWENSDEVMRLRLARGLRLLVAIGLPALAVGAALRNHRQADHRNTRFLALYVDRLLDNLQGRQWLVTDGVLDDVVLLRARERGIRVRCLNLAQANNPVMLRTIIPHLKNVRLRNTANLGLVPLIQEWITSDPEAGEDLALMLVPDLWALGNYEIVPSGLVFLGATSESVEQLQVPQLIDRHMALWDEIDAELQAVPENASRRTLFYRDRIVRPRTSFVGNNVGFLLETLGRADDAFAVYRRVLDLDPENVSALLNWATMVFGGRAPEQRDAVVEALDALNRRLDGAQLPIWSLSRVYGFVSRPEAFAQLGWSWASSGQPSLALRALERAAETTPPEQMAEIRASMAQIHLMRDRPEESERVFFEMLLDDAGNRQALMGLVRIFALRGDTARAREHLRRAEQAGVPRVEVAIASALIAHVEGDTALARALMQEQVDLHPSHAGAWVMMCAMLTELRDESALRHAIERLEALIGVEHYETFVARAGQALMLNDPQSARDYFLRASRLKPNSVALLERILRLDFKLADKAGGEERARALLRLDLNNGLANYILGSLAVERGQFAEAEDYLRRSVAAGANVGNLNDLAVVLLRRGQLEEAEVRINQAFAIDNQDHHAWDTYGSILKAKGQLEDAEMAYKTALRLEGSDLRVHLHLAELYVAQERRELAAEILRSMTQEASTLPTDERRRFDELHVQVFGTRVTPPK